MVKNPPANAGGPRNMGSIPGPGRCSGVWTEIHDIVQKTGSKTIPKKKKCKKVKWLSGEALQIAEKRREVKSKGEKERYKHLNTEFQRIARRDKKTFLRN